MGYPHCFSDPITVFLKFATKKEPFNCSLKNKNNTFKNRTQLFYYMEREFEHMPSIVYDNTCLFSVTFLKEIIIIKHTKTSFQQMLLR